MSETALAVLCSLFSGAAVSAVTAIPAILKFMNRDTINKENAINSIYAAYSLFNRCEGAMRNPDRHPEAYKYLSEIQKSIEDMKKTIGYVNASRTEKAVMALEVKWKKLFGDNWKSFCRKETSKEDRYTENGEYNYKALDLDSMNKKSVRNVFNKAKAQVERIVYLNEPHGPGKPDAEIKISENKRKRLRRKHSVEHLGQ